MSHIAQVRLQIKDMGALRKACAALGLEFVEGKTSHRYYYTNTGPCAHVIRVAGLDYGTDQENARNSRPTEVGVVANADGKTYSLNFDPYGGGYGLVAKVGQECLEIKKRYAAEVAAKRMRQDGYVVSIKPKGLEYEVVCTA